MSIARNRWVRHRLSLPSWVSVFWLRHVPLLLVLGGVLLTVVQQSYQYRFLSFGGAVLPKA